MFYFKSILHQRPDFQGVNVYTAIRTVLCHLTTDNSFIDTGVHARLIILINCKIIAPLTCKLYNLIKIITLDNKFDSVFT